VSRQFFKGHGNCVVVMENITRHQQREGNAVATFETGAQEVAGVVISATVTFLALFPPFLFVKGLVSLLFHELIVSVRRCGMPAERACARS